MAESSQELTRRELGYALIGMGCALSAVTSAEEGAVSGATRVALPPSRADAGPSLAVTLARRRSVRRWREAPLSLAEVGTLLWAAQGVTHADGRRSAPSAGALYPLELDLVAGRIEGLASGLYRYRPATHELASRTAGDRRAALGRAAHGQLWLARAPALVAISAVIARTAARYGARAERYVAIEVGHAAQNLYLQATALGLGTVEVGAFDDAEVARLLELETGCRPLALLPVGRP